RLKAKERAPSECPRQAAKERSPGAEWRCAAVGFGAGSVKSRLVLPPYRFGLAAVKRPCCVQFDLSHDILVDKQRRAGKGDIGRPALGECSCPCGRTAAASILRFGGSCITVRRGCHFFRSGVIFRRC